MSRTLLLGASRWTAADLAQLPTCVAPARGVILGDPFCQFRMFDHGAADIPIAAAAAKEAGLIVALQTPVYLTDPVFDETLQLARLLDSRGWLDLLFIQDIGGLVALADAPLRAPICWSFWSRTRSDTVSADLLALLRSLGVSHFETSKCRRVAPLQQLGMNVVYRLFGPEVVSFGRVCYNRHVTGRDCAGGPQCWAEDLRLTSEDGKFKLRSRGHALEFLKPQGHPCPGAVPEFLSVYVDNPQDLMEAVERYGTA